MLGRSGRTQYSHSQLKQMYTYTPVDLPRAQVQARSRLMLTTGMAHPTPALDSLGSGPSPSAVFVCDGAASSDSPSFPPGPAATASDRSPF